MANPFGDALRLHLKDQGRSQQWLVEQIAQATGRPVLHQTTVARWLSGENAPPDPPIVFAIEDCLGLAPGTLSRPLGYLPVGAADIESVPAAIDADPALTVLGRRVVLKVYEDLVADHSDRPDG